jgi:hypothetical protein
LVVTDISLNGSAIAFHRFLFCLIAFAVLSSTTSDMGTDPVCQFCIQTLIVSAVKDNDFQTVVHCAEVHSAFLAEVAVSSVFGGSGGFQLTLLRPFLVTPDKTDRSGGHKTSGHFGSD